MTPVLADAQVHHIALRRGGGHAQTGEPPAVQEKLDRLEGLVTSGFSDVATGMTNLRVEMAGMSGDIRHALAAKEDHEQRLRAIEARPEPVDHAARLSDLADRVGEVEARPQGITARQLWLAVCSGAALMAALASIVDKFIH